MRALLLTLASLAAAGAANASSVENVTSGQPGNSSISQRSCAHCPPLLVTKRITYVVPDMASGTDRVELKEINGEMKMVRTEAWRGGSPVVFISKASQEDIEAAQAEASPAGPLATAVAMDAVPMTAQASAIVDAAATTGSLATGSMASMASVMPQDKRSQKFNPDGFELRLK